MYILNHPEDSVLKRHAATATKFRQQEIQRQPPTDSILRRHHQQLHASKKFTLSTKDQSTTRNTVLTASISTNDTSNNRRGFWGLVGRLLGN